MPKLVAIIFLLFFFVDVYAQEIYDEQEVAVPFEDDFRDIIIDTTLYYNASASREGIFRAMTKYGLSFVANDNRGVDGAEVRFAVAGLELSSGVGKYPDYGLYTALGSSIVGVESSHYDFPSGFRSVITTDVYDFKASSVSPGLATTYVFSQKRYNTGLRIRAAGVLGCGWSYALSLRGRFGNDAFVKGVFTEAVTASFAVDKHFQKGIVLSLFAIAAPQQRGAKGWTENIVYNLTGDNLYNPYWGRFEGRVRNARVNRDFTPLVIANLFIPSKGRRHSYSLSVGYRFGERSRSGLSWFDGLNPAPDYYRNLPNHRSEPHVIERLTSAWRLQEEGITQINWNQLCEANIFSDNGESKYIQSDRVESLNNIQIALSGVSDEKRGVSYSHGIRLRSDNSRFSRRVRDMLGAVYVSNQDPFTGVESDMRNPARKVLVGDVFDYNYDVIRQEVALYGAVRYRKGRWSGMLNAEFADVSWGRNGYYEKWGLPGKASFGRSAIERFATYNVSVSGRYHFTVGHHLSGSVLCGSRAPQYEDIFLSPDYSNIVQPSAKSISIFGLNVDYRFPISYFAEIEVAGYMFQSSKESSVDRYYDDIYAVYGVLLLENIKKQNWGVEVGVRVDITEKLELMAGVSVGSYIYKDSADVTIYEEATQRVMLANDKAYLNGFIHTNAPQMIATVSIAYSLEKQWRLEASALYADRRYVSLNPLRRTSRITSAMESPEALAACVNQERLPAATVVDLGVTKGFTWAGVRFFASLSINNIFGRRDIIYGGYEPMRIEKTKSLGVTRYKPFPSRYNYSYPRTILALLTCRF